MSKLTKQRSPTIKEVQKVTGWSVPEMAAFFEIDRKAIYNYNTQNESRLPKGRWYELMHRKPEIFNETD